MYVKHFCPVISILVFQLRKQKIKQIPEQVLWNTASETLTENFELLSCQYLWLRKLEQWEQNCI